MSLPPVAAHAVQLRAEPLAPARFGDDPRAQLPGRVVPHMLTMSTGQLRDPVAFLVLVKADDLALHGRRSVAPLIPRTERRASPAPVPCVRPATHRARGGAHAAIGARTTSAAVMHRDQPRP